MKNICHTISRYDIQDYTYTMKPPTKISAFLLVQNHILNSKNIGFIYRTNVRFVNSMTDFGDERVLEAAEQLFKEHGYKAVSVSKIAENTKLKKSTLYHHFSNKEEIFVNVHLRIFEQYQVGLEKSIQSAQNDIRSKLEAIISFLLSQPTLHVSSMVKYDMDHLSEDNTRRLRQAMFQAIFGTIGEVFESAITADEIKNVDPNAMVGLLLSLLEGTEVVPHLQDPSRKKATIFELLEIIVTGLQTENHGGK